MKATRRLCFDPVSCVVTVDVSNTAGEGVLTVAESDSHFVRRQEDGHRHYPTVHGSVVLLGMSFSRHWEGPAVVLVDLPDERIRGGGVASMKRTEPGQVDVMLNATTPEGESFELHLHCYENQSLSMFSGPLKSTGS